MSEMETRDGLNNAVNEKQVLREKAPFVSYLLLGSNILLFLLAFLWGLSDNFVITKGSVSPVQISFFSGLKINELILGQGEWWRICSSMWVHLDFMHVLFNMYGLFQLGPILERIYGSKRFFIIYMGAGLLGGMASLFLSNNPSGGASGAIYGLAGGLMILGFKYREHLPERVAHSLTYGMLPWIVVGIGIGFLDAVPMDNAAHIGGLISGGLITYYMATRPEQVEKPSKLGAIVTTIVATCLIGVLLYTLYGWQSEGRRCLIDDASFIRCYGE